ncbi:MAG: glycosyltransferase family 2 protein [Candidatus Micrarchaeota archaeon]|nr:glycosyltransferase family 2 protein [Candidatus Micrarchaeota archaeon]
MEYIHVKMSKLNVVYLALFLTSLAIAIFYSYIVIKLVSLNAFIILLVAYTIMVLFTVISRFPGAFLYNPTKYLKVSYQPAVTIVIPAYNEQDAIKPTILSALSVDYPKDKLEVIVVNDGSTDNTAAYINEMLKEHKFTFIDCKENRGKRYALYEGFKKANGSIVAVMDSDTLLAKDFVREIVKPFKNSEIGGVCGHANVIQENTLSKMQETNYFTGFHLYKKYEALFDSVTCLSGCGSAYRKKAVLEFLDEWINQKFLGVKCTYGEDRGLTTLLLRNGWKTVYLPQARTSTHAPLTIKGLLKQRLRWRKSFNREVLWQSKFMYKRKKGFPVIFYTYAITNMLSPLVALGLVFILPLFAGLSVLPFYLVGVLIVAAAYTSYSKLYDEDFSGVYMFLWVIFNLTIMQFLAVYAWFNMKDNGWGTR